MAYKYYQIELYENKEDSFENLPLKGVVKCMKWLKYDGEDGNLDFDKEKFPDAKGLYEKNLGSLKKGIQAIEHRNLDEWATTIAGPSCTRVSTVAIRSAWAVSE